MQSLAYLQGRRLAQAAVEAITKGLGPPWKLGVARNLAAVPDLAVRSDIEDEDEELTVDSIPSNVASRAVEESPASRQQRREEWRSLTTQQILQQLKSQQAASNSLAPASGPHEAEQPASSWRSILAAARQLQDGMAAPRDDMLTDTFGRKHTYLRISLTERCNLRCLYCMPAEGIDLTPSAELLTSQEILRVAGLFAEAGVSKIRLTGGEPTLKRDIENLVSSLAALPGITDVGLTSNGIALPRKLASLQSAGMNLLNISLDTLRPDRFEQMTRRRGHDRVLRSIQTAIDLGYDPVKVNVVLMRGVNDDEIPDFVELTRHKPINVRFIEYMPFDGNVWSDSKMLPYRDMIRAVENCTLQQLQRLEDPQAEVAKNFRVPGYQGSVSFITSMTKAFCGDCNRLRIMADGNLKVCLFGANEVSLRDAMRGGATDEELQCIISAAVDRKKPAHAGMFALSQTKNRTMIQIGG